MLVHQPHCLTPSPDPAQVSLGSGAVPPAPREKSMSSYLDTGSVLIESACETERTDAVLATMTSLIPEMQYFRCACVPCLGAHASEVIKLIKLIKLAQGCM